MAHKKVLNPKDDFWEQKQTNRQRDFDALEMAKQQEAEMLVKKRLKTVRIDRTNDYFSRCGQMFRLGNKVV